MKLYTIKYNDKIFVATETVSGKLCDLESLGVHVRDMNELIVKWDSLEGIIKDRIATTDKQLAEDYKILAPIVTPMQDILCLGVNYHDHIEESKAIIDFSQKTDTVYFSKRVNYCTAPNGKIPNYDFVDKLDYEVELGVVLKKDAFKVSVEDAKNYILGYTIINDVSARDLQLKHQQWYLGKSLDGYTPMGPCIVTADELEDVHNLSISCYVNGEKRQNSNTRYMITSVEEAISELSQGMTLKAGTVIASGTPGGVAMGMRPSIFLKSGDVIKCEIEQLGILKNIVE